jgi:hypothetical protein
MRKNIANVIAAFNRCAYHKEDTCHTNGTEIFSYQLCIARRDDDGTIWIMDRGPTRTTNSQISAVKSALR